MTDPKIGWLAWEAENSGGYAHASYKFRMGLGNAGATYVNAYTGGYDLLMALCTPTAWLVEPYVRQGKVRENLIIHTMFEAEPLPPGWVQNLNACGAIWTPSQYCVDLFKASGVKRPIFKTGYGVDAADYQGVYRDDRIEQKETMRFGIWADTIPSRKNVFKAVQAFVDAGLPDADLDVKLHSFAGMNEHTAFVDKSGRPLANVTIHTGAWPRKKLVRWLQSLDCMIYLSGGEGYGLMPLEAAACGLTTICHNSTGMKEYLNDQAFYLVESDGMERAVSYTIGYGYESVIPKPNYEQAVELIRYAYNHRQETYDRGFLAQQIAQRHTWEEESAKAWEYIKLYHQMIQADEGTTLRSLYRGKFL